MFISYAQNFEDVMLWRALKHIERGFYIDIGAWLPETDSVTKAFYELGWSGINIEPNPDFNQKLQAARPRDHNLCIAIGDREGTTTINLVDDSGLSTLNDAIAERHKGAGWKLRRADVTVKTLVSVWHDYVPPGQDVHFLKIDVEGLEEAVLRGNDWTDNRPWIVVVEATLPSSETESYHGWEPVLVEAGYRFCYADGLNRYYLAQEHAELIPAFRYPPNVFDEFRLNEHIEAEASAREAQDRAARAEDRAAQFEDRAAQFEDLAGQVRDRAAQAEVRADVAEERAVQAEKRAVQAEKRAARAEAQVGELLGSTSWRLTAPLRRSVLSARGIRARAKGAIRTSIVYAATSVRTRPALKRLVLAGGNRLPGVRERLIRVVAAEPARRHEQPVDVWHAAVPDGDSLGRRARGVYRDLKAALQKGPGAP